MDGIQPLIYAKSDTTQEEALIKDDTREDDVGITKEFSAWWKIKLEDGDDDGEGRHIHQCINDVEEMGAVVGEVAGAEQ